MKRILFLLSLLTSPAVFAQLLPGPDSTYIYNNYYKIERQVPMRDGVKLFTSIYIPKDATKKYPIMLTRTPYSCGPYGENKIRNFWSRNSVWFFGQGYIVVVQDVRGSYMSEGTYEDIRPFNPDKKTKKDTDEASDTYDAVEWMIRNIPNNNGRVGVSGVSYPGFYTTMAALSGHPAIKAVSPQAPVTDWFLGDDVHHNGAFFLMDCFDFDYSFGVPHPRPTERSGPDFVYPGPDSYDFFLKAGSLKSITQKYFGDSMKWWQEEMNHPNYDQFWKDHTVTYHIKDNIKPAVLVTGGLFDAEDCWGGWNLYKCIEKQSPATNCKIVEGPWFHGGWNKSDGSKLGNIQFGSMTSDYYYKNIEMPFFNYYLKGEGAADKIAEATIFFTGQNKWRTFAEWPPKNVANKVLYLQPQGKLSFDKPVSSTSYTAYVSDPSKPVPYTEDVHLHRTREYMTDDQRFAARRTDVITFETEILTEDVTLAGPVIANLVASISTTDADFIVKVIDVFPDDFKYSNNDTYPMGGYQMLVRGEVMRGKFRNSFEKPEAFVPGKPTPVSFELPDVAHTFQKGHKIMVQIQSSWFPLVDRNPQQFLDIYHCDEKDFVRSTIQIWHDAANASNIVLPVLKE